MAAIMIVTKIIITKYYNSSIYFIELNTIIVNVVWLSPRNFSSLRRPGRFVKRLRYYNTSVINHYNIITFITMDILCILHNIIICSIVVLSWQQWHCHVAQISSKRQKSHRGCKPITAKQVAIITSWPVLFSKIRFWYHQIDNNIMILPV